MEQLNRERSNPRSHTAYLFEKVLYGSQVFRNPLFLSHKSSTTEEQQCHNCYFTSFICVSVSNTKANSA